MRGECWRQGWFRWKRRIPWDTLLIATCWLYLFPYSAGLNNPNERTRVLQARALVQFGQLNIGEAFRNRWGGIRIRDLYGRVHGGTFVNDVGITCTNPNKKPPHCAGKIYPAKGPGLALLGVPALALARAVGFVPDGPAYEDRATWVVRYGAVGLLMFLALIVFGRLLREGGVARPMRARILLGTALGTSIFPYSISFVGHALAGGVILIGLYLLHRSAVRGGWGGFLLAVVGGHAVAWAELMEYHAIAAIAVVSLWVVLSRARWRLLPGYVVGSGAALGLFMYLHKLMFHHPLKTGHFALMTAHNRTLQSKGFLGMQGFYWKAIVFNLFDPYMGLLCLMPWVLVGLFVGWPLLFRKRQGALPLGLTRTIAAIPIAYLLFIALFENWRSMNGWSYGPRYLTPSMLCMACVAGFGWNHLVKHHRHLQRLFAGLVAASVVITAAVTMVYPSPPDRLRNPFGEFAVPLLLDGWSSRNLLMFLGPFSLVLFGVLIAVACVWILWGRQEALPGRRPWFLRMARWSGVVVALLWILGMGRLQWIEPYWHNRVLEYCKRTMEGVVPQEENTFFRKK